MLQKMFHEHKHLYLWQNSQLLIVVYIKHILFIYFSFLKHPFSVTLSGASFGGFLLQARDAANPASVSTVGTFTLTNPGKTQLLTCNKQQVYICTHAHKYTKLLNNKKY